MRFTHELGHSPLFITRRGGIRTVPYRIPPAAG
jgi:hypothetical protein